MVVFCNYPGAPTNAEIIFEHNWFLMTSEGPYEETTNNFINYFGPGNMTFYNNTFNIFMEGPTLRWLVLALY